MAESKKREGGALDNRGTGDIKRTKLDPAPRPSLQDDVAARKAKIALLQKKLAAAKPPTAQVKIKQEEVERRPTAASLIDSAGDANSARAALLQKVRQRSPQVKQELGSSKPIKVEVTEPVTKPKPSNESGHGEPKSRGLGLNTPVHPLLFETARTKVDIKSEFPRNHKYLSPDPTPPSDVDNPYFDRNVESTSNRDMRRKRGLAFNEPGKFIKKGEELRRLANIEQLKKQVEERKRAAGIVEADILAGERNFKPDVPPNVEWWDQPLLSEGRYDNLDQEHGINLGLETPITLYIEHPIPINPPWEKHTPSEATLHMTKNEIKRKRKNERSERHKEAQDRIRLGLDPAPPPKVKPSNVMAIFPHEAIKNPTAMEERAKHEVEQRRLKHEEENGSRKLTAEERYEKLAEKAERDKNKGLHCAVFRVETLADKRHQYLVNVNAIKSQFTGMAVINEAFCLVIIEGGPLQVKKFTKLMMRRIPWTSNAPPRPGDPPVETPLDLSSNRCRLVWHGQLKNARFARWSFKHTETEQDAKDALSRNEADNFWVEARCLLDDDEGILVEGS